MHFRYVLAIYLVRMRRNNVNCASSLKTAISFDFNSYEFRWTYEGDNILAIFTR